MLMNNSNMSIGAVKMAMYIFNSKELRLFSRHRNLEEKRNSPVLYFAGLLKMVLRLLTQTNFLCTH